MKKITQLLSELPEFLRESLEILFPEYMISELLFFDIETTGLSAKTSSLYLIGACYYNTEKQTFELIQYFAEEYDDEPKLLKEFHQLSQKFTLLLHYNGRSFDLPYLNTKCEQFQMPFHFPRKNKTKESIKKDILSEQKNPLKEFDIYQIFHKDNTFFNGTTFPLKNKKQKTMEALIDYHRKDTLDGKELIQVYSNYCIEHRMYHKNEETALLSKLLLHNHDDLCGLVSICPLIGYSLLYQKNFTGFTLECCKFINDFKNINDFTDINDLQEINIPAITDFFHNNKLSDTDCFLYLKIKTKFTFLPISGFQPAYAYGMIDSHNISILIPGKFTELKFFFSDYRNYYYLPDEDIAIHKSVASFVDKKRRCKATPNLCYQKKRGYFFPQPALQPPMMTPVFYQEYQGEKAWFEWTKELMAEQESLINYAIAYITSKENTF